MKTCPMCRRRLLRMRPEGCIRCRRRKAGTIRRKAKAKPARVAREWRELHWPALIGRNGDPVDDPLTERYDVSTPEGLARFESRSAQKDRLYEEWERITSE